MSAQPGIETPLEDLLLEDWARQGAQIKEQEARLAQGAESTRRAESTGRDDLPLAVTLTRASSIPLQPIDWLWRGFLARRKLQLLAGPPGTGKSTIAFSIAATVSRGGTWPDGTQAAVGNVLIWSGEDDAADTIVPRLKAAGADLERIFIVGDAGSGKDARAFDPSQDIPGLEFAASEIGGASFLIVDPVVSAVSGDSHKNVEVRRALQPLVDLGARLGAAILGISHFSKGTTGRDPLERVTGSVAFGAIARIVLVAANGDDGRLLARAKSNIGPDGGGFGYVLEQCECDGIETSMVRWGDALDGTAQALLNSAELVADSPRAEAHDWLEDLLSGAPVAVKTIKAEATAAGFSWRTIERAKSDVGVIAERISAGNDGSGYWIWRVGKSATGVSGNPANPTTNYGGLADYPSYRGLTPDDAPPLRKTAIGGVRVGGLPNCSRCDGEGCRWCAESRT